MPRRIFRKKNLRRRVYRKRRPTVRKVNYKVNRLMRAIETKHADFQITPATLLNDFSLVANTEGQFSPYKVILPGTGDFDERIGDKITVKYLDMNVRVELLAGIKRAPLRVLCIVQKYSIPSSSFDNPNEVGPLYQLPSFSNTDRFLNALRNWDNRSAFVTLYDKIFFPSRGTGSDSTTLEPVMYFKKRLHIPSSCQNVHYHNFGNTVNKNQLWVFFLTSQDNEMQIQGSMRMAYTDL